MHGGLGEEKEYCQNQRGLQRQGPYAEKLSEKDNTDQGGNGHDAPDRAPLPVKGPAYLIKDKKPHEEDGYSGNAIKLFHREIKGVGKQLDSQNKKQVCQAAREALCKRHCS